MTEVKTYRRLAALIAVVAGFSAMAFAGPASAADESSWLCKPGQADNPCLGNVDGTNAFADGSSDPLGYTAATDAKVDCFYLYPTQSEQETDNADLSPDKELKDVAVNQARQFSRTCDVYAPLYRQYTLAGLGHVTPEMRDIAYADVVKAWNDYLENYNQGRGVILVGHSQGSSHLARLINEEIDQDDAVRDKVISAIIPGANVFVPKGELVGGQFQNVPGCETADQLGCVIAYSMYNQVPEADSRFARVNTGYWVNPNPRPDENVFEVLCVNPGDVAGANGVLEPLADLNVFLTGTEGGFLGQPDFYRGECRHEAEADWLNVSKINESDARLDLANIIATAEGDLHLGDVNLALDTLVGIATTQTEAYGEREAARKRLPVVKKKLAAVRKNLKARQATIKKLSGKRKKAKKQCSAAKKAGKKVKQKCRAEKSLTKRIKSNKKVANSLNRQIRSLEKEIRDLNEVV